MERMIRAQAVARAQAYAATQVLVGTVVTLISSAFGFVAALAWNDAIHDGVKSLLGKILGGHVPSQTAVNIIYALVVTLLAVVVVYITNRVASRVVKKSAIDAEIAGQGGL
jgi:hypothetical protein